MSNRCHRCGWRGWYCKCDKDKLKQYHIGECIHPYKELKEKYEQLKAERDAIKSVYDADTELIKKLEAERDRYKAALEEIDTEYSHWNDRTDAAWPKAELLLHWITERIAKALRGEDE